MRLFCFCSIPGWSCLLLHCGLVSLVEKVLILPLAPCLAGFPQLRALYYLFIYLKNYLYYLVSM